MSMDEFKFMMIQEFCPSHEMQKLESKLWNHAMVGVVHVAYIDRFHELARLFPHLISGALTDEAVRNGSIKKVKKRGNMGETSKDKNGRDDNKRTRAGNVFATIINPVGRDNMGTWTKCTICNSYHAPRGPCRTCFNYNRPSHLAKDCRGVSRNVNPVNARNPSVRACYECGSTDHIRSDCSRLNRAQEPEGNRPNQVAANNGGRGRRNQGNQARGRAFMLGAEEARQDLNIMTEEIVVVRDFPKVLPDDLSGLPLIREIKFRIELILGATPNLAFLSSENTSSTNEVSTASGDFGVSTTGGINQVPSTLSVKKSFKGTGRNLDFKEKRHVSLDKSKIECYNCHKKGHFARECRSGRNQGRRSYGDNGRSNAPTNESSSQALVAQDGRAKTGVMILRVEPNYDTEREKHNKAKLEISGYEIALESLESTILGHEKNEFARTRAVVNTGKGKMDTDLKKSRWVWSPKGNYLDHVSKDSGSFMLKRFDYANPQGISKSDHAVVDSGCSSHMTGNKAYLSDYEDYNGGFVAFGSDPKGGKITGKGKIKTANLDFDDVYFVDELNFKLLDENQVVLRAPRKDDVYSLDLKNIVPSGGITCLYANAIADESKLWHRRLGHVNFKNINKLVKGHLVRGLPSKVFVNDHTCVACKKGKQHKASCKAKLERIIRKPLKLLHMDLFGPVSVESINKKRYCLVVTDDFSRFSWVFFLATKDETSEILCKFIIGLENQLNHNVKIIRCDNGTEFKNHAMNEFCAKKGIKREFSVARTPQQNGVKSVAIFEGRVLVTKPQNKTPYELLIGKSPSISFMRPFGCPLTILNTLDSLGKFDGKSDEGYLLGYSTSSKAFRVYNKRTKRVEENLHINFLEDQPNVTGTGPNWMFDLDFLTNSMNYIPVSVENQVNVDAGTQDSYVAGSSAKDKGPTQEYILLPLQPHRTRILVEDVPPAAHEKPSESSPKANDVQDSEDAADKEEQHQMKESEQVLQDELEKMVTQELAAKAMNDVSRQAFEEEKRRIASQKKAAQATSTNKLSTDRQYVSTDRPSVSTDRPSVSTDRPFVSTDRSSANTPYVSAASTPTGANASESSFVYLGGKIPIDASTLPNADLPIDPNMPDLEDASDTLPTDGIFNGAYDDDEDVGAVADFNNMDNTIANRTNHKDHQNCLFACFLSQEEPKTISQALQDESWVEAMQEELLQFKLQKVWVLVDLPYGKKEEGIDYDEVFAPVAKIEAIRLFLVFASYMGFTVYQMDVKSAFLYGTIEEEVYVHQPPGFVDPAHPNKVYKVIKALYGLHQAPRAWYETLSSFLMENGFRRVKQQPDGIFISQDKYVADILKKFDFLSIRTATTPIESNKPLVKDEDGVDVHVYRSMIGSLMYLTASRPDIMFAVCACARFQVTPKASHLNAVKRIFSVIKNLVAHSRTKHIEIRFHEKRLIEHWIIESVATIKGRQDDLVYSLYRMLCEQTDFANGDVFGSVLWVLESH
ncbi:putative ribonuclease H-like domain-containing protein [Tanacetum coccineum]